MDDEHAREERARRRRAVMVVRKTTLDDPVTDPWPVAGAEAISIATRLSLAAWALGGHPEPPTEERRLVFRFVPWSEG
jgi:hypothetical protein